MSTTQTCRIYLHPAVFSQPDAINQIVAQTGLCVVVGDNPRAASLVSPRPMRLIGNESGLTSLLESLQDVKYSSAKDHFDYVEAEQIRAAHRTWLFPYQTIFFGSTPQFKPNTGPFSGGWIEPDPDPFNGGGRAA